MYQFFLLHLTAGLMFNSIFLKRRIVMKKLLISLLLCLGAILARPGCGGCCGTKSCDMPCEEGNRHEDGGVHRRCSDGTEVVVYEDEEDMEYMEHKGKGKKTTQTTSKRDYKPVHPTAVEGNRVRFLDKNAGMK